MVFWGRSGAVLGCSGVVPVFFGVFLCVLECSGDDRGGVPGVFWGCSGGVLGIRGCSGRVLGVSAQEY